MFAVIFNGKIETENPEEFVNKFGDLIKDTNSEFIGRIEQYELARYVDYQKIEEPITIESNVKTERDNNSDI